jgi:hypothetical protein
MRIGIACWDMRQSCLRVLNVVDLSVIVDGHGLPTPPQPCMEAHDYVWSLTMLRGEHYRMLGIEAGWAPWLSEDARKAMKRLGRLIGACCLQDIVWGRHKEAERIAAVVETWLTTSNWCSWCPNHRHLCLRSDQTPTTLEAACTWVGDLLHQQPARSSIEFDLQFDFVLEWLFYMSAAHRLLLRVCEACALTKHTGAELM